jgi:hypothetical protein
MEDHKLIVEVAAAQGLYSKGPVMSLESSYIIQAHLSDSADLFLGAIKVAPSDKSD